MRFYKLCLPVFVVLVIVLTGMPVSGAFAQYGDTLATGQELFQQGNLAGARQKFEWVLDQEPEHAISHYFLGQIERTQGNPEQALKHLRKLTSRPLREFENLHPVDVYRFTGEVLVQLGRYQEALDVMKKAKGINKTEEQKEELNRWLNRAKSRVERQQQQELQQELETYLEKIRKISEQQGTKQALTALQEKGEKFGGLKDYKDYKSLLEQKIQFRSWQLKAVEADQSMPKSRLEELISQGKQYLEHDRDQIRTAARTVMGNLYSALGLIYYKQGNTKQASEWFKKADPLEVPANPDRLHAMASIAYQNGNTYKANQLLQRVRQLNPNYNVDFTLSWMVWLWTTGLNWLIFIVITGLLSTAVYFLQPKYTRPYTTGKGQEIGTYLLANEYPQLACWAYNWLCRVGDMEQRHIMNWQQALRAAGNTEKMGEVLEEAHRHNKLPPDGIVDFAWHKRDVEGDEAARPFLEDALEHWDSLKVSRRAKLAQVLSDILFDEGEREQAFEVLLKLQEDQEPDSDLVQQLVRMAASLGRWDEWRKLGKNWLEEIKSGYIQADYQIGYSDEEQQEQLDDPGSISKYLHDLYREHRDVALENESAERLEFILELVEIYKQDRSSVRELLTLLVQKSLSADKLREYGKRLAQIIHEDGQSQQAANLYKQLYERFPDDKELAEQLGQAYLDLDQRDKALSLFRDLLTGQSDHVGARQGIQRIGQRFENEGDYDRALQCYKFIMANSHVQDPNTMFRMAMTHYRKGQIETALNHLQKIKQGGEEFQTKILSFILRCLVELEMYETAVSRLEDLNLEESGYEKDLRRTLRYWGGRAHEGEGNYEQAIDFYQKIVASDMEYADVQQRLERLKKQQEAQAGE